MDEKNSWVDKFAKSIRKFLSDYFIPFTTPFFALYNCFKLMEGVESKQLRVLIFVISMIYVIMSLLVAIYVVTIKGK